MLCKTLYIVSRWLSSVAGLGAALVCEDMYTRAWSVKPISRYFKKPKSTSVFKKPKNAEHRTNKSEKSVAIGFPMLRTLLVNIYIAIPATSVDSEHVFSMGSQVCSDRRSSRTPQHIEQLVFLSQNM